MSKWNTAEPKMLLPMAIVIALAVHLLLLLLFRYQPRHAVREGTPTIPPMLLQLEKPENRELREWIRLHDPTLIAAPDAVRGYGAAAQDPRRHAAVADLPQVPALTAPLTALTIPPPSRIAADAPIPAAALRPDPDRPSAGLLVTFNGRAMPELARKLAPLAAPRQQVGNVELAIDSSAVSGVPGPCRIVRSSGVPAWDQTVQSVIAAAGLPGGELQVEVEVGP